MNDVQKEYVEKLENVVKQIVSPLKVLPPEKVLELIYDKKTNLIDENKEFKNKSSKDDDL